MQQAKEEAILMLELVQDMFETVTSALSGESSPEKRENITLTDKKVNRIHRRSRRKIFEHLSFAGNRDLFSSLATLSVVNDIERIGDYNKNIADVIDLVPNRLDLQDYGQDFADLWQRTREFFAMTLNAIRDDDINAAAHVLNIYDEVSDICDGIIKKIMIENTNAIPKDLVALILLLRYFKRVNAHLKNVCSAVINPFHRIGYKPKKKHMVKINKLSDPDEPLE